MGLLRKLAVAALALGVAGAAVFWVLTIPKRLSAAEIAALGTGNAKRGERIFHAGGCTSCHARPKAVGAAQLELAGGLELKTPFGIFVPPNISSDPTDGIGAWSLEDFANAMLRGVSPGGRHFYPAFPYPSYARMQPADVADLFAYMKTLPAVAGKAPDHQLGFPFNIRRSRLETALSQRSAGDRTCRRRAEKVLRSAATSSRAWPLRRVPHAARFRGSKGEWLAAQRPPRFRRRPQHHLRRGGIGSWSETDIAYYLEAASRRSSIRSAAPWSMCRRTSAQLTADDPRQSPPTEGQCRRTPTAIPQGETGRLKASFAPVWEKCPAGR